MRRARPCMGTLIEIGIAGDPVQDSARSQRAIEAAFQAMADIENCLSFQQPGSELSLLNRHPGRWVPMSRHSLRILRLARELGKRSEEHFNCTVGGRLVDKNALPCPVDHDFLPCGSSSDLEIRFDAARLKRPVLLTLDGIAKGYAVDRGIHRLRSFGIRGGWINAGGDLRVFGDARLNILQRNHRGLHGSLSLQNGALASSRMAKEPSPEFPALLVSRQSETPVHREIIFSVMASSAWRADALTKVAASLPDSTRTAGLARLGGRLVEFQKPNSSMAESG